MFCVGYCFSLVCVLLVNLSLSENHYGFLYRHGY